jgi:XapX domain-containing protein
MRIVAGVIVALLVGALCRWCRIPVPAPSTLFGALLVACVTLGYLLAGYWPGDPPRTPADEPAPARAVEPRVGPRTGTVEPGRTPALLPPGTEESSGPT